MTDARRWRPVFEEFISHLTIDSRETGVGPLVPWGSQVRFLDQLCLGLDAGVRHFVFLKARQLGISTISLAVDLFWILVYEGTQGALIVDDEGNKEKFRVLLERYLNSLPKRLRVGVKKHNRNVLALANGSNLDYLVAGKKKGNVTLGQSRGLNFVHATEVGSYGSVEGMASLVASLARTNPNRLYMFESTAHGHNLFYDLWVRAQEDELGKRATFIGWWSNPIYCFDKSSPYFAKYWDGTIEDEERRLGREVYDRYGFRISPGQLAWHRYTRSEEIPDSDLMNQNYPWTEEQAFIVTGRSFFPGHRIADDIKFIKASEAPVKLYRYLLGANFLATKIEPVTIPIDADLKVYEEPNDNGVYVMGIDPAWGRSDYKDRSAIEIFRCYADKLVQVAEYATDDPENFQVAWVMAHLAGAYKNCWINLEITGPGAGVMQELRHLRQLLDQGYLRAAAGELGLLDVFTSVRWYLYHRPDSMGAGYVFNWKTNRDNKMLILNQMRDNYTLRMLTIRSLALLDELEHIVQDGSDIGGEGTHKDDRAFATALANKAYIDWVRPSLIAENMTYAKVVEMETSQKAPQAVMVSRIVEDFFRKMEVRRGEIEIERAWEGVADE